MISFVQSGSQTWYYVGFAWDDALDFSAAVFESDDGCYSGSLGDASCCDTANTCGWGEGDCDSDAQCASGLTCVDNVGAEYGYASWVDVCE